MALCGGITADLALDCNNMPVAGTGNKAWLMNFEDIAAFVQNNTNAPAQVIEGITLKSGKTAFFLDGRNNSIKPKQSLKPGTYVDTFTHALTAIIFNATPVEKEQIEQMVLSGKTVIVVENNYRGVSGNGAFELYGQKSGLKVTAVERDPTDAENLGMYMITWSTAENSTEPNLPATVFDTDHATTLAMLEALL